MKNFAAGSSASLLFLLLLSGCGGSSAFEQNGTSSLNPLSHSESGTVYIPDTSVEQPGDLGVRMHTNHLIFVPTVATRATSPGGLSPAQLRSAYGVSPAGGSGVIAIVDAYNYPTALNDFNFFSKQFGLPSETSTNATLASNKVFQVVYASGKAPSNNGGWSQEMALDIEWAHAMAPAAKIVLVEANSASTTDLVKAENVAKALAGVKEVSNSWGGSESSSIYSTYDSTFTQPGVIFFASGGDVGGGKNWPALSSNVVAVGGTSLHMSGNAYLSESAWNGTGCGPSAYEARPSFQLSTIFPTVTKRFGTDICAIADPNTGVSVYDSYAYQRQSGWLIFGGTSVACPVIAAIENSSGANHTSSADLNLTLYSHLGSSFFHDVTTGSAGSYAAGVGYDYPTGVGSPTGPGAF